MESLTLTRMVWTSLLVLLVAIPIGSLVFPRGRAVYVFGTSVMVLAVALGLAVAFNGGLSPGLALKGSNHYRCMRQMIPTLRWGSADIIDHGESALAT